MALAALGHRLRRNFAALTRHLQHERSFVYALAVVALFMFYNFDLAPTIFNDENVDLNSIGYTCEDIAPVQFPQGVFQRPKMQLVCHSLCSLNIFVYLSIADLNTNFDLQQILDAIKSERMQSIGECICLL
jgi:hypothetical protein